MRSSQWAQTRLARILPHIIDTLFLVSGLCLAWQAAMIANPPAWLWAKIIGLVAYIILGAVAMRSAPRKPHSQLAFAAAISCFCWIVSVAMWKSPLGVFLIFSG